MTGSEAKEILEQIKSLLRKSEESNLPYQYTAEEKAAQLHISVSRLYKIKHKFPHKHLKGSRRLFFQ